MKNKLSLLKVIIPAVIALYSIPASAYAHGADETPPPGFSFTGQSRYANGNNERAEVHTSRKPGRHPQDVVFHHLTIDDGLSHSSVLHVFQDSQGFIWAATVQGINKYDGMSFTTFTPQPSKKVQGTPQFYQTIFEDRDGILWFCNYGAGFVRHDPERNTWKYYRHDEDNSNSLANDTTWYVFQDREGILWISTFGGLSRFDPATEQFTNYRHDPNNPNSPSSDVISQIKQDDAGMLWIGTLGGLDKFDPGSGFFTHYRKDPDNPDSISDNNIESIWIDPDGSLWIGTQNGLNHFDPVSGHAVRYFHDQDDDTSLSHNYVVQVMRDSRGQLWVSTWGGGINRFDEQTRQFIRYRSNPHDPDSLSNDVVSYFSEDNSGALWFGTLGGIDVYDPGSQRFARYQHLPGYPNSLPRGRVREILQDQNGIFWIAMVDQGLVRFDRDKNSYTRYAHDPDNPNSLSNNSIYDIHYDPRGWLWVATTAGLNKFDLSTETWTQYHADPDNPNALTGDWISGVAVDSRGDLWLTVYSGGLQRFDPIEETFTHYAHDPDNPDSLAANNRFNYVMIAADGKLWIGGDASVSRFDPETGKAVNFTPERHGISGLTSDQSYQDRQGRIWVATYSGVNRFDPGSNRFTPYPDVRAVLADNPDGTLWVVAGKSLAHFDPDTGSLRRYDEHDGLLSNALEPTAGYTSPEGEIFVGGAKGFNSFFPGRLHDNPAPPKVVFTGIELQNQPLAVGGDSPLQKHINFTEAITLPHDYTVLTLKFAALSYRAPQKNQYVYKLAGFDRNWVYTDSSNRLATYTNLDPGTYTFRVKASNNDGVWNEQGAALNITITPPWWATWWFRLVLGSTLLTLTFNGYRWRVSSLQQRSRKFEEQVAERTRELAESNQQLRIAKDEAEKVQRAAEVASQAKSTFLANMSHELRTPLNAILGFSSLMHDDPLIPEGQQQSLHIINRSGEHLLNLINNILDMAKVEAGKVELDIKPFDLGGMLRDVIDMMRIRAQDKGLTLSIDQSSQFPRYIVGDDVRLRQILVNLVGNALKFTDRGGVTIRLGTKENPNTHLIIDVEDSGSGISPEEQEKVFKPFSQAGDHIGQGTGLGLAITRQFVQLMGGSIALESTPGKGSLFRIILPLCKAQESDIREPKQTQARKVAKLAPGQPVFRLLIVEDQRDNQLLLTKLLESVGFQVKIANNGEEGIQQFQSWHPHFIWMDRLMPVMDGLETTQRIRELPDGKDVKIVALTASAFTEERKEMLEGGMDDCLCKPYRPAEIYDCLSKHLGVKYLYKDTQRPREKMGI